MAARRYFDLVALLFVRLDVELRLELIPGGAEDRLDFNLPQNALRLGLDVLGRPHLHRIKVRHLEVEQIPWR